MKNETSDIAILGGAGFLGTRLAKRLNSSNLNIKLCDIAIAKESNPPYFHGDICQPETFDSLGHIDAFINLAAVHRDDIKPISLYDDINIGGAQSVCDAARKHGVQKIIFTSSVAIYGFADPDTDESGKPNYFNDYGRTKYFAEKVYKEWQAEDPDKRTLVIVRPTVIFGEGNRGNVYNLLNQIASKKFLMFGKGKNIKSMAYVENVAAFIEYSLSFNPGLHVYNYVDKPDFDMNNLVTFVRKKLFRKNNVGFRLPAFIGYFIGYIADLFSKITNKPLPVSSIRVKKFMGTTKFASSISKTSFIPPISLEKGLSLTLNYEFVEDNSDKKTFESE